MIRFTGNINPTHLLHVPQPRRQMKPQEARALPEPMLMVCRGGVHWWASTSQLLRFSSFSSVLLPRLFLFSGVMRFSGEVLVSPDEVWVGACVRGIVVVIFGVSWMWGPERVVIWSRRSRGRSFGQGTSAEGRFHLVKGRSEDITMEEKLLTKLKRKNSGVMIGGRGFFTETTFGKEQMNVVLKAGIKKLENKSEEHLFYLLFSFCFFS